MRRTITLILTICICFVLQTTVFQSLSFAGIAPNLMLIVVSSFGFMRGKTEGMWIGFSCGLIVDLFFGPYIGIHALIYMYVGYLNGLFQKNFYADDIKLPMALISVSDVACNLFLYFFLFLIRGRFHFLYYLRSVIIPELIYTLIIAILLYYILLKLNQHLEGKEKRSVSKLDF